MKIIKENATRIIGIIMIIAGIIAFKQLGSLSAAFFIPGIIMIIANKKTAQKEFKQFISTFKLVLEKKYFLITLYDTFSWFGLFMATYLLGTMMNKQMIGMEIIEPGIMIKLLTMAIAYFAVLIILSIIIYSAFKGMIWLTIAGQEIKWDYFVKFSLMNAVWFAIWIIPALIIAIGLKQDYFLPAAIAATITYIHLTTVMQYSFTENRTVWASIGDAFKTGIGKIKNFLLPGSYMAVAYLILMNIFWVVPREQNIIAFASILLIVFYLAGYRLYMSIILDKIT